MAKNSGSGVERRHRARETLHFNTDLVEAKKKNMIPRFFCTLDIA
jgi:hypothetical protein